MKSTSLATGFLLTLGFFTACQTMEPTTTTTPAVQTPIWQSDAYRLYRDKVAERARTRPAPSPPLSWYPTT
ncbi:hypothetical protein [Hymenobacter siberiensis]|uniref:hypothetical protein n=1 Tax=Hymenobacter siberiensis TaxID=2848396 RepID=UPI001C1DF54F|nr:hypothetical protein [Hymenobacter siberiensis]MBU6122620.1 hypothetical protein [Hymenobacter siberiensis]